MTTSSIAAYQVPIPWDEFEAPTNIPVCRAASGSIQQGSSYDGAGEQSPFLHKETDTPYLGDILMTGEGENTSHNNRRASLETRMHSFDTPTKPAADSDGDLLGAPGAQVIQIKGGASYIKQKHHKAATKTKMQNTYGSTTECISMTVGNPSSRCYANAPWRAFTWTCALLQETHTEPWGNLYEAVQESLELAEAVDIQTLPGLHRLWKKHDLNAQGDALCEHALEPLSEPSLSLQVC